MSELCDERLIPPPINNEVGYVWVRREAWQHANNECDKLRKLNSDYKQQIHTLRMPCDDCAGIQGGTCRRCRMEFNASSEIERLEQLLADKDVTWKAMDAAYLTTLDRKSDVIEIQKREIACLSDTLQWIHRNIDRVKDFTHYWDSPMARSIAETISLVQKRIEQDGVVEMDEDEEDEG